MRLPESIYESLPYLYVIVGVLFNIGVMYVGPSAPGARYYLAIGILCTLAGLVVFAQRRGNRTAPTISGPVDAETH